MGNGLWIKRFAALPRRDYRCGRVTDFPQRSEWVTGVIPSARFTGQCGLLSWMQVSFGVQEKDSVEQMSGWATVTHAWARTKPLLLKTSPVCDCHYPSMMPPILTKAVARGLSQDFLGTISQSNIPSRHLDVPMIGLGEAWGVCFPRLYRNPSVLPQISILVPLFLRSVQTTLAFGDAFSLTLLYSALWLWRVWL